MFRIGILIILILLPLQLNAHSPLEFSIPKNGALIDSTPNELVLHKDISKELNLSHILTLPKLPPGKFIITWRAMGEDGHVLKGNISFEIRGN